MVLALVAGIVLGLSPVAYPLVPVVVGYAGGGKTAVAASGKPLIGALAMLALG